MTIAARTIALLLSLAAALAGARAADPSGSAGSADAAASSPRAGAATAGVDAAGSIPAAVTISPKQARVGDRIGVTVTTEGPEVWLAQAPEDARIGAEMGPFRVLGVETGTGGALTLWLMPRETGQLEIPSFEVTFRAAGKGERKIKVPAQTVAIASVLGDGDATIADIRPPVDLPVPWPWKAILLWTLAAAALAALVWALVRRLRRPRRPQAQPEEALPPGVTPDAWVRAQLDALLARRLVEAGKLREFHIELAEILRRYLELRYRIPALERTTEEVSVEMRRALLGGEVAASMTAMLERCDRVKFAKHVPGPGEVEETIGLAREVIERTTPAPAPESGPQDASHVEIPA